MKINITKEIMDSSSLAGHLVLHGLTEAFKEHGFSEFVDNNTIEDEGCVVDIKLMVNDIELQFLNFVKEWDKQTDRIIVESAKDLIREKFRGVSDLLCDLEERVESEIEKHLEPWEVK